MARLVTILALVLALAAPAAGQTPAVSPVTDALLADPPPESWLNWRRTQDGWGYSPLNQIDRGNVGDLRMVWSWAMEPGSQQTTPLVHEGVMYLASPGNIVQALDAATGDLLWEHRREFPTARGRGRPNRNIAIHQRPHHPQHRRREHRRPRRADRRGGRGRRRSRSRRKGYMYSGGSLVVDGVVISGMAGCNRASGTTAASSPVTTPKPGASCGGRRRWRGRASRGATPGATCR